MVPLPFRLRVPGRDLSVDDTVAWTTFRLNGLLRFDGRGLRLEWSGTGAVDAVTGVEVRSETVVLPVEHVEIALNHIRSVRLLGGWWRPTLEITTNDLTSLAQVPGSEGGRVRLRFARRDRPLAIALVATILQSARTSRIEARPGVDLLSATTPPEGSG